MKRGGDGMLLHVASAKWVAKYDRVNDYRQIGKIKGGK